MTNTPTDAEIDAFLDSPVGIEWVIADKRERYRLLVRATLAKWGTPQQEAQEPCGWTTGITWRPNTRLQSEQVIKITRDAQPNYGYTTPIYTAPQPAPAPLSERDAFEAAWEKLHGKRPVLWSHMFAEQKMETPPHSEGKYFARSEQAAWELWQDRAAIAARGGK